MAWCEWPGHQVCLVQKLDKHIWLSIGVCATKRLFQVSATVPWWLGRSSELSLEKTLFNLLFSVIPYLGMELARASASMRGWGSQDSCRADSFHPWVLGTELRSLGSAASTFSHWPLIPLGKLLGITLQVIPAASMCIKSCLRFNSVWECFFKFRFSKMPYLFFCCLECEIPSHMNGHVLPLNMSWTWPCVTTEDRASLQWCS